MIPAIRKALDEADGAEIAGAAAKDESFIINVPTGEPKLSGEDVLIETSPAEGYACAEDAGFLTALDTSLNEELINEGFAREIVRSIQDARKQAGLEVSDRIVLGVSGSDAVDKALAAHRDYVMNETLATEWQVGQADALYTDRRTLGEESWTLEFRRAAAKT